jgi:hypothetical protein
MGRYGSLPPGHDLLDPPVPMAEGERDVLRPGRVRAVDEQSGLRPDDLQRDFARGGAQLLLALVNTERFAATVQPLQHL